MIQEWCGHRGEYKVTAILCGRRGSSDRLMECGECGRGYLASDLGRWRAGSDLNAHLRRTPAARTTTDHPAHERTGPAQEVRNMNVPLSPAGNTEARQQGSSHDRSREDLGEGHIMGNLTADPELRFTPTGRAVARLRVAYTPRIHLATTDRWADGPTEYYDLDVWGQQGERCVETLAKGDRIVAAGNWTRHTWADREGESREGYCLTARDIGPSLLFRLAFVDHGQPAEGKASHD